MARIQLVGTASRQTLMGTVGLMYRFHTVLLVERCLSLHLIFPDKSAPKNEGIMASVFIVCMTDIFPVASKMCKNAGKARSH